VTPEQHAEIMALLAALVKQGKSLRREVADLTRQCDTLEVLIHGLNQRFDE